MSVEPNELMNEIWTQWQGHVVNDAFPLGRYLGCSERSGVFMTHAAVVGPSDVAIKLVAHDGGLAQLRLPQWDRAGGIPHPHLLRMLQWGECELDGLPFLYVVMEYADQTLEQVLQRRALTEDEAREMLLPTLEALVFLHSQDLVQGQLKPANILVVGDQLKLASDTIQSAGEGTAGDIWALGACLFEALTRRAPPARSERGEGIALPLDFPPGFKDVVARCLDPIPQNRPSATQLLAWARGEATLQPPAPEPTPHPVQVPVPAAVTAPARSPTPATSDAASLATSRALPPKRRAWLPVLLGAAVVIALAFGGVRLLRSHGSPSPAPIAEGTLPQAAGSGEPATQDPHIAGASAVNSNRGDLVAATAALHEVMPDVPPGVRRSIRGHIKVSVRIIVDPDGSVVAATAERGAHSRYFSRLASEAARQWTFAAVDGQSRRTMQIRFDFDRDETTGSVAPK